MLNNDRGYYKARVYLEEALRHGVQFLLPDINRSARRFSFERGAIRMGLSQIKGLSAATTARLFESRRDEGPYFALQSFLERVKPDRQEARHLVQCGALDAFEIPRPELLWRLEISKKVPQKAATGTLFESAAFDPRPALPRLPDYSETT